METREAIVVPLSKLYPDWFSPQIIDQISPKAEIPIKKLACQFSNKPRP
jgi:hypothetical protein